MRLGRLRHPILTHRRAEVLPAWVRRGDRAVNRWINASAAGRGLDLGLRRLSRAADRGRLWFAIAAALVIIGKPRAALRGVLSLAASSAVANLLGKHLFGGPRPLWAEVPERRQLHRYPTSASFPSGHSASAAGFAVGVAIESPVVGAVVVPIAAAVAYSRLHVGAHWASDVAGGVLLGAGVAAAGAVIVPPRRPADHPEGASTTDVRATLPDAGDGAGVLIVLNEKAGTSVVRPDPRPVFAELLPDARVAEMTPDMPMDRIVREAAASDHPPRVLAVYGGDGSVSRMAEIARDLSLPMLAMPGGTFNHFVRAIGVETPAAAIEAARTGRGVRVGVASLQAGDAAPITVLNTISVGIYPDFVAERVRRQDRWGKWVAAVIAAAVVLRTARPIMIEVDGEPMRVWSMFISIGQNAPGRVSTMQRRSLNADELDLRILHARGSRLRAFGSLAFGRKTAAVLRALHLLPPASDVQRLLVDQATVAVPLRDGRVVPYAHDGELEETPPLDGDHYVLHLAAVPDALEVYAP
ncbi:bifunctional phosphatase PAP2/diacylglycerol kinase family protein [Microbacterium sp. P05]|uniref:bifunctional phosphatase PAP2/diacylglycerol kinase family protein n=1 Tax=Microbacterium sp. P05 TaxID=3366948 RepID=UPI003744DD99